MKHTGVELNTLLRVGSITYGQDEAWQRIEAKRENHRLDHDWRNTSHYRHERFMPYGDPGPGPGMVAKIEKWQPRVRRAVFAWIRRSRLLGSDDLIRKTMTVPDTDLFNVSDYKPGDFRQFFADPRTREQYLQWAPALLTAEEYHAGNIEVDSKGDLDGC